MKFNKAAREESLRKEIREGREAQALLDHPAMQAALKNVEAQYRREWLENPPDDAHKSWYKLHALADVLVEISATINSGLVAERMVQTGTTGLDD